MICIQSSRKLQPIAFYSMFTVMLIAICYLSLTPAYGQSSVASLSGQVTDQDGAIVPGAAVMIVNPSTGFTREVTTNDQGSFTVPFLPPATYTITVRREGFAPIEVKNVVLNVGDQKTLQIQLKAGDVNATVNVDMQASTVSTDGGVSTVVNRQFVANMPLNGRTLQALIQMAPGVVLTPSTGGGTGAAQFSVNGQRTTANYFTVDGVSANTGMAASTGGFPGATGSGQTPATTALGGTNSMVSLDALQEFRIDTSTFAAEFGRTPGGQISLVTRRGTNQFHGSASEYFRHEAMGANDWFANANRQPKAKARQNIFGGVFGGPIKKDRLFFFTSYEGLRLQQPVTSVVTLPTVATRTQAGLALKPYLDPLPLPNGVDFGNGTAQFAASYSNPAAFDIFSLRIDARLTDATTGFFRFNNAPSSTEVRVGALSNVSVTSVSNRGYTGGITWLLQSNLTADLRFNWTNNTPSQFNTLEAFHGAVVPNVSDVFPSGLKPANFRASALFPGGGFYQWGPGSSDQQRQFNAVSSATWLVGAHQLKFGADWRQLRPRFGVSGGKFEFIEIDTIAELRAGMMSFYQITNEDPAPRQAIISNLSLFAQDTWHVARRLNLTYGLRFERVPSPREANGKLPPTLLGFESNVPQSPRLAPPGTPLIHGRFGSFAPRLGAAYQLSTRSEWETTLRGGVGVFYDLGLGEVATAFQEVFPFFASKPLCCNNLPFPVTAFQRTPPTLGVDPPQQLWLLDPNLRMPYTLQWNGALEQSLGAAQSVTVSYVGAAGRHLLATQFYRQRLAEWPTTVIPIRVQRNLGRSRYDALQIKYERRLRRRLQALASYTLGWSKDNASSNLTFNTPPASQAATFDKEYGPSDFDVRHVLSSAITYDIPGFSSSAPLRLLSMGWGADLLFRYQSAFPISPTAGTLLVDGVSFTRRADSAPGQPLYINDPTAPGGRRFNRAAFSQPAPGQQGNATRNGLRGFGASQVDLAVQREFKLGELARLQLRGELFNLFNHPNFGLPVANISSGLFGQSTSMLNSFLGGLNGLYQMGGPRSGQLSVKVIF